MKKVVVCMTLALGLMLAASLSHAAAARMLDAANTSFGWQALSDKPPAPTIEVVAGPKKGKALQLSYKFEDGLWIAMVKNANFSLGEKDAIRFWYKGNGPVVNLKVKVTDGGGAVFGYTVPAGSVSPEWKEVSVPRSSMNYLWGGSGADSMNWGSIAKLEFTLDLDKMPGTTYTIDKTAAGKLSISAIDIVTKGAATAKK
jgi:hypothetical protein